jgi:hypothetical protein
VGAGAHQQAVDALLTASGRAKQDLRRALEKLLSNPYQKPDYQEHDDTGRVLAVVLAGRWAITFWLDHFVSEIRIVSVERADR